MTMHRHSGHLVTQLDTLLLMLRMQIDSVAATNPTDGYAAFECRIQHLRNTCELLATWACDVDVALTEMLPILARHADSGAIASGVTDDLLEPLRNNLGCVYVDAAMGEKSEG